MFGATSVCPACPILAPANLLIAPEALANKAYPALVLRWDVFRDTGPLEERVNDIFDIMLFSDKLLFVRSVLSGDPRPEEVPLLCE